LLNVPETILSNCQSWREIINLTRLDLHPQNFPYSGLLVGEGLEE